MKIRPMQALATVLLALTPGLEAAERVFELPSGMRVPGQVLLLAIDDVQFPLRQHVCLYPSKPYIRPEPVLTASKDDPRAPDQVDVNLYGGVVYDDGLWRMWYNGDRLGKPGDAYKPKVEDLVQGPPCYAESRDGIHWVKPRLGQYEIGGSAANNALRIAGASGQNEAAFVIKDSSDPDPARRYKMVFNPKGRDGETWVARTATSPDGIHWIAGDDATEEFIEPSGFFAFNGYYLIDGQRMTPNEFGYPSGREGKALLSPDFRRWVPGDAQAFLLPEPMDPAKRGGHMPYDQVHLGVGAASFGSVAVGFFGRWHNYAGANDPKQRWSWFPYGRTSGDLGLVVSDDGLHFREPIKGWNIITHEESPATPVPGRHFPTILCQTGNGILDVGDKTYIYHGRWLNAAYNEGIGSEIALATLPRDRWGGLGLYARDEPYYQPEGSVWTAPVRLPSGPCRIFLNADGATDLGVELADERFDLLPGYSGAAAGRPVGSSGIDIAVAWPKGDLGSLGGRTIRLKVNFQAAGGASPRLYAISLR